MLFSLAHKPVKAYAFILFLALTFFHFPSLRAENETAKLLVFYSPSCHTCIKIKQEILPLLESRFKGTVSFVYLDISDISAFKRLVSLQQKNAPELVIKVPLFFLNGRFLNGEGITADSLTRFIDEARGLDYREPDAQEQAPKPAFFLPELRFFAVAGAGLVDGINPCAFAVILFFLSFLALQGYRRRQIALVGSGFILAVFLTYILIGLGIFNSFYRLSHFFTIARVFNAGIGIVSIVFGILAVYDICLFVSGKGTEGFVLQLPKPVKDRIHFIIGRYYRKEKGGSAPAGMTWRLCLTSFVTGFLVCLLEAVCTGQLYVPTIAFIIRGTAQSATGFWYLLLYNLLFVMPLVVILFLVLTGMSSSVIGVFFRKHIVTIKAVMAGLFFGLGIYLLVWR